MKILHFILGKANRDRANGVNQVIYGLVKYLSRTGVAVTVIGKASNTAEQGATITYPDFSVTVFSKARKLFWTTMIREITAHDLVHLHGVYNPWNIAVAHLCRRVGTPYVVTLHDGLAPQRMRKRFAMKWLFSVLVQRRFLQHAAMLHVLTREEQTTTIDFVGERPTAVIENGIDPEDYEFTLQEPRADHSIVFGYLGRLSEEKNLHALIAAFKRFKAQAPTGDTSRLRIAGPRNDDILVFVEGEKDIMFEGPKFGEDKRKFLRELDWFVHPSLCDAFSITAMEAMASGTPVVISRLSDVSYYYNSGAFLMCEPTVTGLTDALLAAQCQQAKKNDYAKNGRKLVAQTFNWRIAATKMQDLYERIVENTISHR